MEKMNENQVAASAARNSYAMEAQMKLPAAGGSVCITAKIQVLDDYGDLLEMKTVIPTISGTGTGFTIDGNTVTAAPRLDSGTTDRNIDLTVSHTEQGVLNTRNLRVSQVPDVITLENLIVNGPLPANSEGGDFNLTTDATLRHSDGTTETKRLTDIVYTVSSPGTITSDNKLRLPAFTDAAGGDRKVTVTATATYNGQEMSASKTIYQEGSGDTYVQIDGTNCPESCSTLLSNGIHTCLLGKKGQPPCDTTYFSVLSGNTVMILGEPNKIHVVQGTDGSIVRFEGLAPGRPVAFIQIANK